MKLTKEQAVAFRGAADVIHSAAMMLGDGSKADIEDLFDEYAGNLDGITAAQKAVIGMACRSFATAVTGRQG